MSKPQEPASGKSEPQPAWMARGEALVHRATQLSTQREQLDKDLEALVSEALAWLRSLSMEERMDASCHALLHRLHQGVFASCPGFRKGKQYSGKKWLPLALLYAIELRALARAAELDDLLDAVRDPKTAFLLMAIPTETSAQLNAAFAADGCSTFLACSAASAIGNDIKDTDLKSYKRRRTMDEREGTALAVGFDQFFLQLRMQQTWQLALTLWTPDKLLRHANQALPQQQLLEAAADAQQQQLLDAEELRAEAAAAVQLVPVKLKLKLDWSVDGQVMATADVNLHAEKHKALAVALEGRLPEPARKQKQAEFDASMRSYASRQLVAFTSDQALNDGHMPLNFNVVKVGVLSVPTDAELAHLLDAHAGTFKCHSVSRGNKAITVSASDCDWR